ncbi:MAG: hypothetical protein KAU38_06250, partial [Desulfobacterales bacterium]|nr:hypothetical protein [Desulfobacterales bacterium]
SFIRSHMTYHIRLEEFKGEIRALEEEYKNLESMKERITYQSDFKIYLTDKSEFSVSILEISDRYDLALLKLHGYKTPFIVPNVKQIALGEALYAIGNPLDLGQSVTSEEAQGSRSTGRSTGVRSSFLTSPLMGDPEVV